MPALGRARPADPRSAAANCCANCDPAAAPTGRSAHPAGQPERSDCSTCACKRSFCADNANNTETTASRPCSKTASASTRSTPRTSTPPSYVPQPTERVPKCVILQGFPMRPRGLEPPQAMCLQGPQPGTRGVDASRSAQIVQIARLAGRIGRSGRDGRCQSVVTARRPQVGRAGSVGRARGYVVIPCGGGGVSVISLARIGVQRSAGQEVAKTHAMRPQVARRWVRAIRPSPHARAPRQHPGSAATSPARGAAALGRCWRVVARC